MNTTEQAVPETVSTQSDLPVLDGTWELKKRNPTASAILGLLGVGAIYFQVQSFGTVFLMMIYGAFNNMHSANKNIFEITNVLGNIKIPLLVMLCVVQYVLFLWGSVWMTKRWHSSNVKAYLRVQYKGWKPILLAVVTTVLFLPVCYFISAHLQGLYKVPESLNKAEEGLFQAKSGFEFWLLVFVICVTPAICEEIFFRGFFQRTLERNLGAKSVLIGGILFGLFHMQPLGLLTLSILGILFSLYFYRSKSLFPSMASHFTNNLIAILLVNNAWALDVFGKSPAYLIWVSTVVAFFCLYFFIVTTRNPQLANVLPIVIEPVPGGSEQIKVTQ